jgi:hypothetical protein
MSLPPEEPPTDPASIPSGVVVDTSVVSAMGNPGTDKNRAFAKLFTAADATACIPPCVVDEIEGETGRAYEAPTRVLHGERRGWMERVPAFTDGAQYRNGPVASHVADRVRERIAGRFDVPEHEVEKTDTLLPGVAVQLLASGEHDRTGVLIKDRYAAKAAHTVLENTVYEELIRIYRGKPFIEWGVDWAGEEASSGRGIY